MSFDVSSTMLTIAVAAMLALPIALLAGFKETAGVLLAAGFLLWALAPVVGSFFDLPGE